MSRTARRMTRMRAHITIMDPRTDMESGAGASRSPHAELHHMLTPRVSSSPNRAKGADGPHPSVFVDHLAVADAGDGGDGLVGVLLRRGHVGRLERLSDGMLFGKSAEWEQGWSEKEPGLYVRARPAVACPRFPAPDASQY